MQDMQPDMNPTPDMDPTQGMTPPDHSSLGIPNGETDHEGAMAKADLYKLANYSFKLFKKLEDDAQLEAWVQAKITKAADYIASVYHYLEYEMEFSEYGAKLENSEVYSESQKAVLKGRLMEAKEKIKALKVNQAAKLTPVKEGVLSGGDRPCTECGGTGMVYEEPKEVPAHVKSKVEKYKRLTKATHAAHKRLDRNNNGIPDSLEGEEEVDEEFGGGNKEMKVGDTKKTRTGELTKTSTGVIHKNTSYHDDGEAEQKSGKGTKSHAKSQSAAEKKEKAPAQKMSPKSAKTWGMKDSEKFDNRDKEVDETYGQGVYEGKPSAGLSKAKKSAVVKDAKAGKDIGKPGKSFDKVAKAAGGGKKGEKIAAAAMWKNVKESVKVEEAEKKAKKDYDGDGEVESGKDEYLGSKIAAAKKAGKIKEGMCSACNSDPCECKKLKESTELNRMKEFLTRLNG